MVRSLLSVVLGAVVGGVTVALVESIGQWLIPPPAGLDPRDAESIREHMSQMPLGAFVAVLVSWAAGSFTGASLAGWIANRNQMIHGLIVGGLLMIDGVATMIAIPHPVWFCVVGVLTFLPSAWLGVRAVNQPLPGHHEGWVPKPVPFVKSKEP